MGLKKNNPGCSCCHPCNCVAVTTTDCNSFALGLWDASRYSFTASGLTNDDCSDCDTWNGSFNLCWLGADTWATASSGSTACGRTAGQPLYQLARSGGFYNLTAVGLSYVWQLATASWACAGSNVLTLAAPTPVPAPCASVPNTITLEPCMTCTACAPGTTMPRSIQIEFAGVGNKACDCDTHFNSATYVLDTPRGTCLRYYSCHPLLGCSVCGGYRVDMTAEASGTGSDYLWTLRLRVGTYAWAYYREALFTSAPVASLDCSAVATLTNVALGYFDDNYFCNWTPASVTLTPL